MEPIQSLPSDFLSRMASIYDGPELDRCLRSFAAPKRVSFRVNQLLGTLDSAWLTLERQGFAWSTLPWFPSAASVSADQRGRLLESSLVTQGRLYVQNATSMLVASSLGVQPGECVLDLAAAPGGKAILLAEQMENIGWLSAVEPVRSRFFKLRAQLDRYGVSIARCYLTDGRTVGRKTPDRFDRVLLDAPCSGEGRFRLEDPATWKYWSLRKVREQARKQVGLLMSAIRALKPGGTLIYSTCTFSPEENEVVIDTVLKRAKDPMELTPLELPVANWVAGLTAWGGRSLHPGLALTRRILPTELMDAFYIAKFTKLEHAGE